MKTKIIVARPIFEETLVRLRQHFDVTDNQADVAWTKASWTQALSQHAGALTTGSDPLDAEVLKACPNLKAVANMAVGYNNFDVPSMTSQGVQASNTPDVLTETTADFGLALLMATARRVTEAEHFLRAGQWNRWRYDMFTGADIHGSTLGILGMGRIGQGIAKRGAHGFGMKVIYHNRSRLDAATEAQCKACFVSKEELLQRSDHLVLVLPYSAQSHHAIGASELAQMKPSATLINIARGGIVDDAALAIALRCCRANGSGQRRQIAADGDQRLKARHRQRGDLLQTLTAQVHQQHFLLLFRLIKTQRDR